MCIFKIYRFKLRFHSTFLKTRVVCIMAADGGVHHQIIKCLMNIFYFWWIELKYNWTKVEYLNRLKVLILQDLLPFLKENMPLMLVKQLKFSYITYSWNHNQICLSNQSYTLYSWNHLWALPNLKTLKKMSNQFLHVKNTDILLTKYDGNFFFII